MKTKYSERQIDFLIRLFNSKSVTFFFFSKCIPLPLVFPTQPAQGPHPLPPCTHTHRSPFPASTTFSLYFYLPFNNTLSRCIAEMNESFRFLPLYLISDVFPLPAINILLLCLRFFGLAVCSGVFTVFSVSFLCNCSRPLVSQFHFLY